MYNNSKITDASWRTKSINIQDPGTFVPHTPILQVRDTTLIEFEDGSNYTGEELCRCLKVLKKLIAEQYPEDLI